MAAKRTGRPPEGPDGTKVEDLERFTLRLEPHVRAALFKAAADEGRPAWRVAQAALVAYLDLWLEEGEE